MHRLFLVAPSAVYVYPRLPERSVCSSDHPHERAHSPDLYGAPRHKLEVVLGVVVSATASTASSCILGYESIYPIYSDYSSWLGKVGASKGNKKATKIVARLAYDTMFAQIGLMGKKAGRQITISRLSQIQRGKIQIQSQSCRRYSSGNIQLHTCRFVPASHTVYLVKTNSTKRSPRSSATTTRRLTGHAPPTPFALPPELLAATMTTTTLVDNRTQTPMRMRMPKTNRPSSKQPPTFKFVFPSTPTSASNPFTMGQSRSMSGRCPLDFDLARYCHSNLQNQQRHPAYKCLHSPNFSSSKYITVQPCMRNASWQNSTQFTFARSPCSGRGIAAFCGSTTMTNTTFVCGSVTDKYGRLMELTKAKEGAVDDAALRFKALRDNVRCCKFVGEIFKRFKNARVAASGSGRRSALFGVCPDAQCG
eukprot:6212046-Pleurochrysis_carterae.AAC.7